MSAEFCLKDVCSFWPAWKYFRWAKNSRWRLEFCALFEYGLRNIVYIFVQEQWGTFWKTWKNITLFLMMKQHGFVHSISSFSNMLQIVWVGRFVEQTLLYKVWDWTKLQLLPNCSHNHFVKTSFPRETVLVKTSVFQK